MKLGGKLHRWKVLCDDAQSVLLHRCILLLDRHWGELLSLRIAPSCAVALGTAQNMRDNNPARLAGPRPRNGEIGASEDGARTRRAVSVATHAPTVRAAPLVRAAATVPH